MSSETALKPSFHRKANPITQTLRDAIDQNRSKEIRGRGAFGSSLPAALAWHGRLGPSEEGTEFSTDVPHFKNGHPAWAYWYVGNSGVRQKVLDGQAFACVTIEPELNRYRCKRPKETLD